jgi:DNA-binding response OmpR family regulator/signal transduction histidine kinase
MGSRRLAILFIAVVLPAALALVWLGFAFRAQYADLWERNASDRREARAKEIAQALEQHLAHATEGPGAIRFRRTPHGLVPDKGGVPWLPVTPPSTGIDSRLAAADALEARGQDRDVLTRFQRLARATDPGFRAGGLLRRARVYREERKWDEALEAYRQLAHIDEAWLLGMPASLLARRQVCALLDDAGRSKTLTDEAASLESDLAARRWRIDRQTWNLVNDDIVHWTGHLLAVTGDERLFADAAEWIWTDWQQGHALAVKGSHNRIAMIDGVALALREELDDRGASVVVVLPATVQSWIAAMQTHGAVSLTSPQSHERIAGTAPSSSDAATSLDAQQTHLPWDLTLAEDASRSNAELAKKTRQMSAGLILLIALLSGGSYLLWRALQRELAVARLQTEFVATVSHEFRTPLASLRHVTDLLTEDDELPRAERRSFYESLGRNTERLSRLIESLLDFSSMQDGRKRYALQSVDARDLVRPVVEDFRADVSRRGARVSLDVPETSLMVKADVQAISQAVWNLLDNAVKYSPGNAAIDVSLCAHRAEVAIAVRDRGSGFRDMSVPASFAVSCVAPGRASWVSRGRGSASPSSRTSLRPIEDAWKSNQTKDTAAPSASCFRENPPMADILIVEDEDDLRASLAEDLRRQGHQTRCASTGDEALRVGTSGTWDLILLDVMLPKMDGLDVCSELRRAGVECPVILLTARSQDADKELGLDAGADDYVTKPFSTRELRARVRAHLRRSQRSQTRSHRFGECEVDFSRAELRRAGQPVDVTPQELRLLAALIRNRGRVLTREQLINAAWGPGMAITNRAVDAHVFNLRRKIEATPAVPRYLVGVRGIGYRFADEELADS